MGGLDAKVGMNNTGFEDMMGWYGLRKRNENEEIRKFMCIRKNVCRWHYIPLQTDRCIQNED